MRRKKRRRGKEVKINASGETHAATVNDFTLVFCCIDLAMALAIRLLEYAIHPAPPSSFSGDFA